MELKQISGEEFMDLSLLDEETKEKVKKDLEEMNRQMLEDLPKVLVNLAKKNIIKEEEIKKYSKDFYAELMNYLDYLDFKEKKQYIFLSMNPELLKKKKYLNKRFSDFIKIMDPKEMMEYIKKEEEKNRKAATTYIG